MTSFSLAVKICHEMQGLTFWSNKNTVKRNSLWTLIRGPLISSLFTVLSSFKLSLCFFHRNFSGWLVGIVRHVWSTFLFSQKSFIWYLLKWPVPSGYIMTASSILPSPYYLLVFIVTILSFFPWLRGLLKLNPLPTFLLLFLPTSQGTVLNCRV